MAMNIALDYDETFTEDPILWSLFVDTVRVSGHQIQFVTFRHPDWKNNDIEEDAKRLGINIVYTSGRQKKHVFPEATIWIDDNPQLCASYDDMVDIMVGCDHMGDRG